MTVMCFPIFPFLTTDHTLIIFVQHWAFPVLLYGHSYCIILIIWWLGSSMEVRNLLFPAFFFGRISASLLYIIHQLLLEIHTNITLMNLLNTQKMP